MKVIETDGSYSVEMTEDEQKVGIRPVDFYKINRTGCSNDVEALHALDPSLCSYNLPPDHITNLCSVMRSCSRSASSALAHWSTSGMNPLRR
jgi:hypothetical protein